MNTGKLIKNVLNTTRHLFAAMILFFIGLACQYIIRFARNLADLITYNMGKSVSHMQWEHFRKNSVGRYDAFYKIAIDNEHSDTPGNGEANEIILEHATASGDNGIFHVNFVDNAKMLTISEQYFNIDSHDLIAKAKKFAHANLGLDDVDKYCTDDFHFIFPIVFLNKQQYKEALVSVPDQFYDIKIFYYGWQIDCLEPNRVWAMTRGYVVIKGHRKPLAPQKISLSFDPTTGKCYKLTGGYVIDRETYFEPNQGLGGLFAINVIQGLYVPVPEMRPWKPSLEWRAFDIHIAEVMQIWKTFPFTT